MTLDNKNIKTTIIEKLVDKMLEKEHLTTDETVLLLRAVGRYADENYDIPDSMKNKMSDFVSERTELLENIFASDLKELMRFFHEDYIDWNSEETFEALATVNEFYTALLGLWMLDEYDPTKGTAWTLLSDTKRYVTENKQRFAPSKRMASQFRNASSMNPIQDLWNEMAGQPTMTV